MFGIFYLLANIIGTSFSGSKAAYENRIAVKDAEKKYSLGKNRARIYTDRLGVTRSLDTKKRISIDNIYCSEAEGKDAYMYDENGKPIRNMSLELREERFKINKAKNDSMITVSKWKEGIANNLCGIHGRPYYAGTTYKDLNNGKVYVCRMLEVPKEISNGKIIRAIYYMDINTGLLVRLSDSERRQRQRDPASFPEDTIEQFIKYFNDKQMREGYYLNSNIVNDKNCDSCGRERDFYKKIRMSNFYMNHAAIDELT